MIEVLRLHRVAVAVNGVALTAALLGRPCLAAAFCVLSGLLLVWAQERMRYRLITGKDRP